MQRHDRHAHGDRSGGEPRAFPAGTIEMALRRIGLLRDCLGHPVERDRHHDDRRARKDRKRRVRVEAVRHRGAEPAFGVDQACDDDHREGEEDRLVDRQEQQAARERQLHLPEHLAFRRSERGRRFDRVRRHAADSERRDPNSRRHRVDHRRDHGSRRPDREEDDDGHQVGEGRDDLGRVEHRRDHPVEAVRSAGDDSERNADEQGERDGDEHQRQRLHALVP